ncbi:homoserine kinase [Tianweitania sp. BSSL-BM11]|uniref:Homoserine kinase n=1 Tax=Tianweitania aestuarii TaxID=2814886 RepID=A0ABS5RRV1_9HYPH|nr:homoserine kinase [Tianweitania aestuarii]MBS9719785.1 homoserine kinase [Tianweitania aestuarii]
MAVYTDVNEEQLESFLGEYKIGRVLSYKGIAEGSENSNFLLRTETGSYILTLYEKRVDQNDLPFFLCLMQHLARKGLTCPLPVERRDGQLIGELAGRPAAIITFLEGMWMRHPTVAQCGEVGRELAALHLAGADFPMHRANALAVDGWLALWNGSRDRADDVMPGLVAEVEADFAQLQASWPSDLPRGIIHADLFPDNVFFLGDRLSGLIDFYFACEDFYAYDIAVCLNAWCFEPDFSFNAEKAAALTGGYQSVRALSAAEQQALPLLAQGSALRFMLTRLYDWLTIPDGALVQKRDPLEYVAKLRFHRGVTTPEVYGIT